jgi:hypothetical protein
MIYNVEQAAKAVSADMLGDRASNIRRTLGLSIDEVARQTGLRHEDIRLFEEQGLGTVELLLSLAAFLSDLEDVNRLFQTPRFTSLDQVTAFENRRLNR